MLLCFRFDSWQPSFIAHFAHKVLAAHVHLYCILYGCLPIWLFSDQPPKIQICVCSYQPEISIQALLKHLKLKMELSSPPPNLLLLWGFTSQLMASLFTSCPLLKTRLLQLHLFTNPHTLPPICQLYFLSKFILSSYQSLFSSENIY